MLGVVLLENTVTSEAGPSVFVQNKNMLLDHGRNERTEGCLLNTVIFWNLCRLNCMSFCEFFRVSMGGLTAFVARGVLLHCGLHRDK